MFNLVDEEGSYLQCCAMYQHCDHQQLVNGQDIIIYFATGRGPLGSVPGMLYMYNDAFILPNGTKPRAENIRPMKKQEILIRDSQTHLPEYVDDENRFNRHGDVERLFLIDLPVEPVLIDVRVCPYYVR